jgi:glutamate synthase (NADPH/NADH) small chain
VLNLSNEPVTIKNVERHIIDRAWESGLVVPRPAARKTGRRVAVVGSGPAGLAAAQELARRGHDVTVLEKADRIGGLLRYGIPDFKMEKAIIDRRLEQLRAEGVVFKTGVFVGRDLTGADLRAEYAAVVLAGGAERPRDLPVPGRELAGVHFAMEFLVQQNRRVAGDPVPWAQAILATGKHVIVVGGGDTGSDCIGTSFRQGALSVTQLEIMPQPPEKENKLLTWPHWPLKMRTSSSQAEGAERDFSVMTVRFSGSHGKVEKLHCVRVDDKMKPVPGSEFGLKADLVLLAMGFVSPVHDGMIAELGVALDPRGNVKATDRDYATSRAKVFAAGDMRRGQSLVVWAIREGRQAAHAIDKFLMGHTDLPR